MSLLATAFSLCMLLAPEDDRVYLKDGKVIACKVTDRAKDTIEIEVDGKKRRIQRALVDKIAGPDGHVRWIDATTTSSKHYKLTSNLPKERSQELLRQLELFYAWFFAYFAKDWRLHDQERLQVSCARTREEYVKHLTAPGGNPPQAYYSSGSETLFLCDEPLPGQARAEQTLFHEAGHQILTLTANFPSATKDAHFWVFEALPCVFEGLVEKGGKLVLALNQSRTSNMKIRFEKGMAIRPLQDMDAMMQAGFGASEYDQAYTFAWFLLNADGGKYRKGFLSFVQDVAFTRVRPDTFEKMVGKPIGEYEGAWRTFVRGLDTGEAGKAKGTASGGG